jgi:putative acetyltransferase
VEIAGALVREAVDADAEGLIALIGGVFAEYPGCVLDVDGEMPQLRRIATRYAEWDGRFWVAEGSEAIVGCIGITGDGGAAAGWRGAEIHHLYVAREARRTGLGERLLRLAEGEAWRRGAGFIELWSDTRFLDAHRFYLRRGYILRPETRELHDLSQTVERHFVRTAPAVSSS